jgi:hypothetical protein
MKSLKTLGLVMSVAVIATVNLCAGDASTANPYFGTLSTVSPAELPAKSAALVSQADSKSRTEATINVVKAAVGLNPAAAAAIVGTIAQSAPEMASVAAATAVALVPDQAIAIAHAAAAAAPAQAGKIVEAVCRVVPNSYKAVAAAVAGVAPGQAKAILAGVAAAIPALQDPINTVLAGSSGNTASVNEVLNTVAANLPVAAPQFGPPYVGIPQSPVNLDPGNGGQVPTGGRNYATPPPP